MDKVRLWRGKIRQPQKTRLAKIERDRNRAIECKQKRHLDEQRQTSAQRIPFLHQSKLLHLQLFQTRIRLLHAFDLFLQLFHLRRKFLRLLHGFRRPPLQWKESGIDHDCEKNNRESITACELIELLDTPK